MKDWIDQEDEKFDAQYKKYCQIVGQKTGPPARSRARLFPNPPSGGARRGLNAKECL